MFNKFEIVEYPEDDQILLCSNKDSALRGLIALNNMQAGSAPGDPHADNSGLLFRTFEKYAEGLDSRFGKLAK